MHRTIGINTRMKRVAFPTIPRSRPVTTADCTDWLAGYFRDQSAKEIARKTGQSPRTAEAVKTGRNCLTMAHLVNMCRADPQFAAAFAEYVGLLLPGDAAFAGALTQVFNAYQRRRGE